MRLLKYKYAILRYFQKQISVIGLLLVMTQLLVYSEIYAQEVTASAKLDTNVITIGNQFILDLSVTHPVNVHTEWPLVPDTFSLFEVIRRADIDTIIPADGKTITRHQKLVLTSFDSGFHVMPPFIFSYRLKGDTSVLSAETKALLVTVNTIPVDTTRAFKDLKGQVIVPLSWKDFLPYIFGVLIAALIAFLVYNYIKKRKSKIVEPVIRIPKRPAHEIAFEALRSLDETKLWQNGNYKGYYTGLSDITRMFIENRWSIAAMEMTTDEILKLRLISDQNPDVFSKLKYLLELSDLVKFAKTIPVVYENEQCMQNALTFVDANKQLNEVKEEVA